jgi:hypothetical protein
MTPLPDEPVRPARPLGPLAVAAVASAGAGLIHAAAAGSHADDRTLAVLFALGAAAQAGWALAAIRRAGRRVALAGAAVNAAMVLAWLASRTVGLPLVVALRDPEPAGFQDSVAAALAAVAVAGALVAVRPGVRTRALSPVVAGGVAALVVALAVPAMAAEHTHGGGDGHDHAATGDPAATDTAATDTGHDHAAGDGADDGHDHAAGDGADDGGLDTHVGGHDHEIPERLDHEPTADQLDAARDLVAETEEGLAPYADVAAATAAGYVSIGDGRSGAEHYINREYLRNDTILDASEPESLVYRVLPDGGRELTTAMYILPPGSTMDDVPDVAGNLTVWHSHDNLCWDESGRLAGIVVNGRCRPGGTPGLSTPMLHVWVVPNDCGPFAGVDARQETGSCVSADAL